MKQEEAAPNKEEAVKTIPDSELDDSAVEVVEVYFFKGVEYDSRTGLPWGMTQEQFDTNNAASRDSAKRIKSIEEEEHEAQSSVSKESDAYNKGIIRKAAAWRKKFNPKGTRSCCRHICSASTSSTETVLRAMVTGATR